MGVCQMRIDSTHNHIFRSANCHFVLFHLFAICGKSTKSDSWGGASCRNRNADFVAQADDCGNANTGAAANADTYASTIGLSLPDREHVRIRDDCHYESFIVIHLLASLSGKNKERSIVDDRALFSFLPNNCHCWWSHPFRRGNFRLPHKWPILRVPAAKLPALRHFNRYIRWRNIIEIV